MKPYIALLLPALLSGFPGVSVAGQPDNRTAVPLSAGHRALVLAEMRQFLTGLQQITDALARQDMGAVATAARPLGVAMSHHVPSDLKQALPQAFRQQGFAVHSAFDQIALDAESIEDGEHTLKQLSDTLSQCVACHASYQIQQAGD